MALGTKIYNAVFKRTSTFALAIAGSCFVLERTLDLACDTLFDRINEGKLWYQIKDRYAQ